MRTGITLNNAVDWAVLPAGTKTAELAAPSGQLASAQWGPEDGTPVLMVPGITGSKEDFMLIGPVLGKFGYRAISVDLAGQFGSAEAGPDSRGHWSLDLHTQDVTAILEELGPAHLVGYSYSGIIASKLVAEHPDLLRSVTFLSAPPRPGNAFKGIRIIGPLAPLVSPKMGSAILRGAIRHGFNWLPKKRKRFIKERLRYTRKQSVDDMTAVMMNAPNLESKVKDSALPKLVTAGSADLWPLYAHRAYAGRIGAQFRSYRSGHSPAESKPEKYAADLVEFYRHVDGAS